MPGTAGATPEPRASAAGRGKATRRRWRSRGGGAGGAARTGLCGLRVPTPADGAHHEIPSPPPPGGAAGPGDRRSHELLADAVVDGVAAFLRASAPPL